MKTGFWRRLFRIARASFNHYRYRNRPCPTDLAISAALKEPKNTTRELMAAVRKEQAKREGHILDEAEKTAKGILEIRDMFTGFNEKSNEIDAGIATLQGRILYHNLPHEEENDNV